MCDGRLLRAVDLPGRRLRLASHGRYVVAVVPGDETPLASRVRIDRIDPLLQESRPLGEFAGEARAAIIGDGRLAVLEPDGMLTVIDIAAGAGVWRTRLTGGAAGMDEAGMTAGVVHVLAIADLARMSSRPKEFP